MSKKVAINRPDFHLKIVQEISDLVNRARSLAAILKGVVNKIADSLGLDVVSVYLWKPDEEVLVLRATRGLHVDMKNPIRLKPEEGLTGLVYQTRKPLLVMPASKHPRYKYFPAIGEKEYESYIGVPILLHNFCLGVLVGQTRQRRLLNPAEETLFHIIASSLAGVLEVADLLGRLRMPEAESAETHAYQGKGLSGGYAVGPAFVSRGLFQEILVDEIDTLGVEAEISRLETAFAAVASDLKEIIETLEKETLLSESEINILHTHLMILLDSAFQNPIKKQIEEKNLSAELAVVGGIEAIVEQFEGFQELYMQERAQDFRDIGEKILHHLLQSRKDAKHHVEPDEGAVLVAVDVGPAFLASLHRRKIAGIVTEKGGETSHTAILAKSLGVPAVSGVENIANLVKPGDSLLVDGETGFVFVKPNKDLIGEYQNTRQKQMILWDAIRGDYSEQPVLTVPLRLTANIGFPADVEMAQRYHLKDVGLFRTEFAFMQHNNWPQVADQIQIYDEVAKHFDGYVTIRTLDVSADKSLPYFKFPREENPLLGLRAIRFSMEYLELFRDQIRAILLTMQKGRRFRILLPMVTHIWEVEAAHEIILQTAAEIGMANAEMPRLGIMMEVPAILPQLEDYRELVDFISIGTNDLIQYLLAVDRNSNVVGHLYSSFHPAVLRTLREIFLRTQTFGKDITVCGEMAGTPAGALALLALQYEQFSVSPSRVPLVRLLGKKLDPKLLTEVRQTILQEPHEKEIERYLFEVLQTLDPILVEVG